MLRIIKHNLAVYFMILACLDFALMGACAKILSEELPSIEVVFFRNFIASFYLFYVYKKSKAQEKKGGKMGLLIFRGICGVLSLYCLFYNVSAISLGTAYAFNQIAPIFATLLAFFIFKEAIGLQGWAGIFIAFFGMLCISVPFSSLSSIDLKNAIIGILSGLFSALSVLSARELKRAYSAEKIALSFMVIGSFVPLFSMLLGAFYAPKELDFLVASFVMPSFKALLVIIFMAVVGSLYQVHLTKSYGIAKKTGLVAGVSYLSVVFSLLIGLILGDSLPSFLVFLGICAIIFGGIILVLDKKSNSKTS